MSKGRAIFIEGRLKLESWEGKDGDKRTKLSVVCENFQFIGGGRSDEDGSGGGYAPAPSRREDAGSHSSPSSSAYRPGIEDEDVPF